MALYSVSANVPMPTKANASSKINLASLTSHLDRSNNGRSRQNTFLDQQKYSTRPSLTRKVSLRTIGWARHCFRSGFLTSLLFMVFFLYLLSPRTDSSIATKKRTLTIHPSKPYKSYPSRRALRRKKIPAILHTDAKIQPLNISNRSFSVEEKADLLKIGGNLSNNGDNLSVKSLARHQEHELKRHSNTNEWVANTRVTGSKNESRVLTSRNVVKMRVSSLAKSEKHELQRKKTTPRKPLLMAGTQDMVGILQQTEQHTDIKSPQSPTNTHNLKNNIVKVKSLQPVKI